jgi:hypothetical protein
MVYCKNCGKPLTGDERFCVNCGSTVTPASTTTAPTTTVAQGPAQVVPGPYNVSGQIPVVMMPPAPVKRGGTWSKIIIVVLVIWFGYYYLTHRTPPLTAAEVMAAQAALAKQQAFDCNFQNEGGYLEVNNGKWTNNATVAIASATLECDQTDSGGTDLDEMRINLKSPQGALQPGGSQNYNPFQMGEIANNASKVHCTVVNVMPPDNPQQ